MANIDVLKGVLSDELFTQVQEATKESKIKLADLTTGGYVNTDKYNALETQLKSTQELLTSKTAEYDELTKNAGDNEALKKQIETLKADNETAINTLKADYEAQLKRNTVATNIIQNYKPIDVEDVMRYVDLKKIEIKDDKFTGLAEQMDKLKEEKAYYFEGDVKPRATGLNHQSGVQEDDMFLKGFNS